jgi:hypothetical protein
MRKPKHHWAAATYSPRPGNGYSNLRLTPGTRILKAAPRQQSLRAQSATINHLSFRADRPPAFRQPGSQVLDLLPCLGFSKFLGGSMPPGHHSVGVPGQTNHPVVTYPSMEGHCLDRQHIIANDIRHQYSDRINMAACYLRRSVLFHIRFVTARKQSAGTCVLRTRRPQRSSPRCMSNRAAVPHAPPLGPFTTTRFPESDR